MDVIARRSAMPAPLASLWTWHIRPGALERLTPPWDRVRVLARSAGDVGEGTQVTLQVPVGPFHVTWIAEHREVKPPHGFVDVQVHGPFAHWIHRHTMTDDGPSASSLEDRIEFDGPLGPPGRLLARRLVAGRLPALLRYRHETLAADLAAHARVAGRARLTVGITGASGMLGTALTHFLTTGGHRVVRFVRGQRVELRPPSDIEAVTDAPWDTCRGFLAPDRLPRLDVVVHLAGAGVADKRWTASRRALIRDSRVEGTATLARALAALEHPPEALLCASAIGFYGFDGTTPVDETAPVGRGFLADVCRDWEGAADPARAAGIRVAHMRLGLVLSPAGGVLKTALLPFKAGLGGVVGAGTQGMSWVGLDDVLGACYQAMYDRSLAGAINVTAPEPVSNRTFTAALGRVVHRPTLVPVPPAALRLLLGRQMADETALSSAWVRPARLEAAGYVFRHRTLEAALAHYLP